MVDGFFLGTNAFMKYQTCVNCEFNVPTSNLRCANCGVLYPFESLSIVPKDYSYIYVFTVLACVLLPVFYLKSIVGFFFGVIIGVPVGLVIGSFFGGISKVIAKELTNRSRNSAERRVEWRKSPHPESLVYKEDVITKRITELSEREQKVSAVLSRVKQSRDEKWEQVRETLLGSLQTLTRQHARYRAKFIEIETVRLQNVLAPFIYDEDQLSFEQIDGHLKAIEEVQERAEGLTMKLEEQRRVLGSVRDIDELARRLLEIQASMGRLQDAFVGRQAVLALQGITPLEEALAPLSSPVAAIIESEIFNIQVAITDFSASFNELESEYLRVQSEEDAAQKISEIFQRGGGY